MIKLGLINKIDAKVLKLSDLDSKKLNEALKTKIVIKHKADYPIFQGFPKITEELHTIGLQRKSFDRQILRLQNLKILNLSDNLLTTLPQELGSLPNLVELDLSNNKLGCCPSSRWSWLSRNNISKNLRSLNLSYNEVS